MKKFAFAALLCISMLGALVVGAADATATSTPTPSPTAVNFVPDDVLIGNNHNEWADCSLRLVNSGSYSAVVDCPDGIGTVHGVTGYARNGVEYSLNEETTLFISGGPIIESDPISCIIKLATGSSGQLYASLMCVGMYDPQVETDWMSLGDAIFGKVAPTLTPSPSITPTTTG